MTWAANTRLSGGFSNAAAAANGVDYGDYVGQAAHAGKLYTVWADNSNCDGTNANGTLSAFDLYTNILTIRAEHHRQHQRRQLRHSHGYGNSNSYGHSDSYGNSYSYSYSDGYGYSDSYGYDYRDSHGYLHPATPFTNSNTVAYSGRNGLFAGGDHHHLCN